MHRNKSVDVHRFAMVPRASIPRASFQMEKALKTTFDAGLLIPVFCEEVLPGDTLKVRMTAFCRLATPIFPVMDNLFLDSFFFFVPNRLTWTHWVNFMGEQANPTDSISFTIPQVVSLTSSNAGVGTIYDYFGIPGSNLAGANTFSVNALPFRAYYLIYNTWFRDENLIASTNFVNNDGPDNAINYVLRRRGKRHDYFTSCLPWPQKGGTAVSVPLGTTAPVQSTGGVVQMGSGGGAAVNMTMAAASGSGVLSGGVSGGGSLTFGPAVPVGAGTGLTGLYADLSIATAATINQLRQSFQIQKLLERDARGGTRYTEIVRSHFGVVSPDARLQRPEYLGGGSTPVTINPIAQTSATGVTGGSTPVGTLAAMGTALAHGHGFHQSFTEHGYIIGLVSVRADMTYQQGLRRHWSRSTRYDYYFPAFAMLGEQAVLNKEIYADGSANDTAVFGYQERWAEYRYLPSEISGYFRSTVATPIDGWHLAQKFTALPVLGQTFIEEAPPVSRVVAVGSGANGQQFLMDAFFRVNAARPMPLYSVPGMIDHF